MPLAERGSAEKDKPKMQFRYTLMVGLCVALLTACGGAAPSPAAGSKTIATKNVWVRVATVTGEGNGSIPGQAETQPMSGDMTMGNLSGKTSSAYMTLENASDVPDALLKASVSSDVAEKAELHTTVREGEIMKMRPVDQIEIPAKGEAQLQPGGFHIMLLNLKKDLKENDVVTLTLTLKSGELQVGAPVLNEPIP